MTTQNKFSSGLESGNLVLTSDAVARAWCAIEQQRQVVPNAEPYTKTVQPDDQIIVAFGTPDGSLDGQEGFVSSKDLAQFEFLCTKRNPVFNINQAATELFQLHHDKLLLLKNELVKSSKSKPSPLIIITGNYVGGTVATLFTLWLLEGLDLLKTKHPLCITFGSPFVGDEQLQKCVLEFSTWKNCFLHILFDQDHTPKLFMARNTAGAYKPFGTILLCSPSGCVCSENWDLISDQTVVTDSQSSQAQDPNFGFPYGEILEDLNRKALCNVSSSIGEENDTLRGTIITQLLAVGAISQQQSGDISSLMRRMMKHETKLSIQKKKKSDSDKNLNDMKSHLAYLEWYKTQSKTPEIGGYYDRYRNQWGDTRESEVSDYVKKLMNYWEDSVKEVYNKPQLEGAHFRDRWQWGGTNYRRMVEPLHIANYYKEGGRNYKADGNRPQHFILLEEWLKKKKNVDKPQEVPSKSKRETVESSLNEDSCFWVHVEEARILCTLAKNGSDDEKDRALQELKNFETYVYDSLKYYTLSPEIFLKNSSFMLWLKEYKEVVGQDYSSLLLNFMRDGNDRAYKEGTFIFP